MPGNASIIFLSDVNCNGIWVIKSKRLQGKQVASA
jgi:hypothetical protein